MPIYVMPDVPPQYVPAIVAQASVAGQGTEKFDRVIGICHLAQNPANPPSTAVNSLSTVFAIEDYLTKWEHKKIEGVISSRILQQPEHGLLRDGGNGAYGYEPETGYLGKDQATVLVEISGLKIKVRYFIQVLNSLPTDEDQAEYCPKDMWRISQVINTINGTSLGGITIGVSDLPNGAIGQTTGSNITLDTNASGYGWYIDPTPGQNEEFLPTSNPNEWVAKAGSEAYGKMDMLSVLLHEYGHALGINHSPDPNDYMGATLTAGVRRLPSAEEMVLIQGLVAQAKAALTAATLSPSPLPIPSPQSSPASGRGSEREKQSSIPAGEGANVAAFGSGSSPSDAFEVALLDANTGASLLGGTGFTRSVPSSTCKPTARRQGRVIPATAEEGRVMNSVRRICLKIVASGVTRPTKTRGSWVGNAGFCG